MKRPNIERMYLRTKIAVISPFVYIFASCYLVVVVNPYLHLSSFAVIPCIVGYEEHVAVAC